MKKIKKMIFMMLIIFCLTSFNKLDLFKKESNAKEITNSNLIVHFLDVGEADSIFIELPTNECMLIDAGERENSQDIINYITNLNYQKIDYILGTHPHADHIGGLSTVIKNFEIGNIYLPKVSTNTKTYENLLTEISQKNLKVKTGKKDVSIINQANLKLDLLSPIETSYKELNNYSLILKLVYGNTSFLFTGDAEELVEKELLNNIDVDVLKVGHHGSKTSTSEYFLKQVTPKYAIISVGTANKYNHPDKEVLNILTKYQAEVYRTDLNGTVKITSNGNTYQIDLEKE